MAAAHFVLVPGYWLGGWAWERVVPHLTAAGHRATALTLPGLSALEEDRTAVSLADHVTAITDIVGSSPVEPVVVAHSGAGRIVTAVLDQQPDAVRRVIYVDSGPAGAGDAPQADLPADVVELALPDWAELQANGASLDGLSPEHLEEFRRRAVPQPVGPGRTPLELHTNHRRDVPATLIACSFPVAMILQMAAQQHPMFAETARLTDLTTVDLPTGHWPMFSRPTDLAEALLAAAEHT